MAAADAGLSRAPRGGSAPLFTLAALVALGTAPGRATAWCQMTTSTRRPTSVMPCVIAQEGEHPLAWRQRCSALTLSVFGSHDLDEATVRDVVWTAIDTWTGSECEGAGLTGLELGLLDELSACSVATHHASGRNVSSIVFVDEGWVEERMHDPRAYALTLVWHDPNTGEIWDVDMDVNEQRGAYAICPPSGCEPGVVDLPNVLTHEMGHYLGLGHTPDDPLATMWQSAEATETIKRDLQPDDVAGLCAIYPPGSLSETCDATPRGGLGLDCQADGGGCRCSAPGRGPTSPRGALTSMGLGLAAIVAARRTRRR